MINLLYAFIHSVVDIYAGLDKVPLYIPADINGKDIECRLLSFNNNNLIGNSLNNNNSISPFTQFNSNQGLINFNNFTQNSNDDNYF